MKRILLIACICSIPLSHTFSQISKADTIIAAATEIADYILYQNHDSSYIRSYADKVSVKLLTLSKYNTFHLWDQSNNTSISYRPDLGVNFGIGAAYKWFALDISTSLGFSEDNISDSKYRDIQGRVLTSKHYLRFRYQYYLGYKIAQISGYEGEQLDEFATRQDIRTMQFGLQYIYAFNYGKFSLKAPFAMNERQRKSAGSAVAGIGFLMYSLDADSSLIPNDPEMSGSTQLNFSELNVVSLTVHFGYMYSFIIKERFFITLGLIPGIGVKGGDYSTESRVPISSSLALQAKTMNAIGYSGQRFYTGIQVIGTFYYLPLDKDLKSGITEGRSGLFIGYRF